MKNRGLFLLYLMLLLLTGSLAVANPGNKYKMAPEISLPSVNGDTVKLSQLRGKVVLIDFWASWCAPCRVANRNIADIYNRFHEKGFEIYGVSIDSDAQRWKSAIAMDQITWLQVNQPGNWNAPIVDEWRIDKIPSTFLVDQDGRIVAVDPSYGVLKSWLKDLLKD